MWTVKIQFADIVEDYIIASLKDYFYDNKKKVFKGIRTSGEVQYYENIKNINFDFQNKHIELSV